MMTTRQRQAMLFIEGYQARTGGVSPTMREIAEGLRLSIGTRSRVHALLKGLEERGFIKRIPHRTRAIEVLRPVSREQWFQFDNGKKEIVPHRGKVQPPICAKKTSTPVNAEPRQLATGGVLKKQSDGSV